MGASTAGNGVDIDNRGIPGRVCPHPLLTYRTLHPQCKPCQNLGRGLPSHSQAMRATRVLLSWTTKVSRRPRRLLPVVGRFNLFRSEQEEIIRTFKAENDASDRKICLYLNILMGGFTLLSVPIFCCLLPLSIKSASSDMSYISSEEQTHSTPFFHTLNLHGFPSTFYSHWFI